MRISLRRIPPSGFLRCEGEQDPSFLGLEESGLRACSPLTYRLEAALGPEGVSVSGVLQIRVMMTCVVTLEPFEQEIVIQEFSATKPVDGLEVIDFSEEIREEILLALPAHPRSACAGEPGSVRASFESASRHPPGVWQALEHLQPPT